MVQLALVANLVPKVSLVIQAVQALEVCRVLLGRLPLVFVDLQVAPVGMDATANQVEMAEMASLAFPVIEAYPAAVAVMATRAVTVGRVLLVPVVLQAHRVGQEQEVYLVVMARKDP